MSRSRKGPLILRKRFSALRSRRIRRTSCSNRSATTASTRPRRRSPWRRCSVWVVSNRPEPPSGESGWFAALFVGTTSASGMPPCRRSRGGVIAQRYRCSVPIGRARNGSASTSRKWSAVWTSDSRCRCARSAGGNGRRLAPGRLTTESPPMRSRPIFVPGGTGSPSGPAKRSKMSKGPFRRFVAAAPRVAATDVAGIEDDESRFPVTDGSERRVTLRWPPGNIGARISSVSTTRNRDSWRPRSPTPSVRNDVAVPRRRA